jgi:hypothetical protein
MRSRAKQGQKRQRLFKANGERIERNTRAPMSDRGKRKRLMQIATQMRQRAEREALAKVTGALGPIAMSDDERRHLFKDIPTVQTYAGRLLAATAQHLKRMREAA